MTRARLVALLILLGVTAIAMSAESPSTTADDPPKFVVALFRHGIRSPTPDFATKTADASSKDKWPDSSEWKVMDRANDCDSGYPWGYLTKHGQSVVQGLGEYYGNFYNRVARPGGFNLYLWADALNQRTRETAKALAAGFKKAVPNANVTVAFASPTPCALDPLFHPFKSQCGIPNGPDLKRFADEMATDEPEYLRRFQTQFDELSNVLACFGQKQCSQPLLNLPDAANACGDPSTCSSPLQWKQRFAYASSASEAFLLEYANNMENVGWRRIDPKKTPVQDMLKLHEFYFDKTDRFIRDNNQADPDLASIDGANLSREILDQLLRKAGMKTMGSCPRATAASDFVGLVGHDTNLASVGALLDFHWQFDDPKLPADTVGLPANDALPAGALVFELRQRTDGAWMVRAEYVTQSLEQMRNGPKSDAFRLPVTGTACGNTRPCEMLLTTFQQLAEKRIKGFLSGCTPAGEQKCPP